MKKKTNYSTPPFNQIKMCELFSNKIMDVNSTFFHPNFGQGYIILKAFTFKLRLCKSPIDGLKALLSITGNDKNKDNVKLVQGELFNLYKLNFNTSEFNYDLARLIIKNNITQNKKNKKLEIHI